jgi:hypothetical protein
VEVARFQTGNFRFTFLILLLHALVLSSSRLVFTLYHAIRLTLGKNFALGGGGKGVFRNLWNKRKQNHADFSVGACVFKIPIKI